MVQRFTPDSHDGGLNSTPKNLFGPSPSNSVEFRIPSAGTITNKDSLPESPTAEAWRQTLVRFANLASSKNNIRQPSSAYITQHLILSLQNTFNTLLSEFLSARDISALSLTPVATSAALNSYLLQFPEHLGNLGELNKTVRNNAFAALWSASSHELRRKFFHIVKTVYDNLNLKNKAELQNLPERTEVFLNYASSRAAVRTPHLLTELGNLVYQGLFVDSPDFFGEQVAATIDPNQSFVGQELFNFLRASGLTIELIDFRILAHCDQSEPVSHHDLDTNFVIQAVVPAQPSSLSIIPVADMRTTVKGACAASDAVQVDEKWAAQEIDGVVLPAFKQNVYTYRGSFCYNNQTAAGYSEVIDNATLHIVGPSENTLVFSDWGYQETLREVLEYGQKGAGKLLMNTTGKGNYIAGRLVEYALHSLGIKNKGLSDQEIAEIKIIPYGNLTELIRVHSPVGFKVSIPGMEAVSMEVSLCPNTGKVSFKQVRSADC